MLEFMDVETIGGSIGSGAGVWDLFWACFGVVGFGGGGGSLLLLGEEEFEVIDEAWGEVFEIGVW